MDEIAHGLIECHDIGLPLDESTIAARRYIALEPADVQKAFQKWIRPMNLARVSQGPVPQ